jgi:phosphoserine phosphatase RsbU/P
MSNEVKGMEVMVVDDNPNNLRLLAKILKSEGYKVRPVPNGKLALAAIKVSPPDLILLDINMPDINGYEVCVQLKDSIETREIPIIFISAMNETIDKVKAFEVGGIDYVTKPFQVDEVLARVKTHLKLYLLQRKMEETNNNLEAIVKQRTNELLKLRVLKHGIELELKIAKEIQSSILPKNLSKDNDLIAVFAETKPARRVGGDFYDFCVIDEHRMFFCIGDVSGKGIPAALFMAIIKTLIKLEAKHLISPVDIIVAVNNFLLEENDTCMFASVFCGIIDTDGGKIKYCNAGHTAPLLSLYGKKYKFLPLHNDTVVGVLPADKKDYFTGEIEFRRRDRIFLYSDGITEAVNKSKEQYTGRRLQKVLNETSSIDSSKILDFVKADLLNYIGDEPQADDITAMILEFKEN